MSEDRKYVRVYYNDLIRDYPEVWSSDSALATWLRMLATADPMWPTPPELPRSVRPKPLGDLVTASLVSVDVAHRFRMKGMDAERTRRSDAGRNAAAKRWQSDGNADGNADPMPKRAETSRDEQSKANARESRPGDDGRADLEAFLLITRRAPTVRQRQLLDGILDRHDLTGPKWSADIMLRHPDDPIGALIEADKAWRAERIAEAQAAEKPKPQPRRPKGLPQSSRELVEHWATAEREAIEARKNGAA